MSLPLADLVQGVEDLTAWEGPTARAHGPSRATGDRAAGDEGSEAPF